MNGEPPQPLFSGTAMCGWHCYPYDTPGAVLPDYRRGYLYQVIPIYEEEAELIVKRDGGYYFDQRWKAMNLPEYLTTDRPNLVTEFTGELEDEDY